MENSPNRESSIGFKCKCREVALLTNLPLCALANCFSLSLSDAKARREKGRRHVTEGRARIVYVSVPGQERVFKGFPTAKKKKESKRKKKKETEREGKK